MEKEKTNKQSTSTPDRRGKSSKKDLAAAADSSSTDSAQIITPDPTDSTDKNNDATPAATTSPRIVIDKTDSPLPQKKNKVSNRRDRNLRRTISADNLNEQHEQKKKRRVLLFFKAPFMVNTELKSRRDDGNAADAKSPRKRKLTEAKDSLDKKEGDSGVSKKRPSKKFSKEDSEQHHKQGLFQGTKSDGVALSQKHATEKKRVRTNSDPRSRSDNESSPEEKEEGKEKVEKPKKKGLGARSSTAVSLPAVSKKQPIQRTLSEDMSKHQKLDAIKTHSDGEGEGEGEGEDENTHSDNDSTDNHAVRNLTIRKKIPRLLFNKNKSNSSTTIIDSEHYDDDEDDANMTSRDPRLEEVDEDLHKVQDFFSGITLEDLMENTPLRRHIDLQASMTFEEAFKALAESRRTASPVFDEEGNNLGIIDSAELMSFMLNCPRPSFAQEILGTCPPECDPFRVPIRRMIDNNIGPNVCIKDSVTLMQVMKVFAEGKHRVCVTSSRVHAVPRELEELIEKSKNSDTKINLHDGNSSEIPRSEEDSGTEGSMVSSSSERENTQKPKRERRKKSINTAEAAMNRKMSYYYTPEDRWKIVTQQSIIRFFHAHVHEDWFPALFSAKVVDLGMVITKVICVEENTRAGEAFVSIFQHNISAVACVNANRKLKAELSADNLHGLTRDTFGDLYLPVRDFITKYQHENTPKLITCSPKITLMKLLQIINANKCYRVWLVDAQNKLQGLITLTTIIRVLSGVSAQAPPSVDKVRDLYFANTRAWSKVFKMT